MKKFLSFWNLGFRIWFLPFAFWFLPLFAKAQTYYQVNYFTLSTQYVDGDTISIYGFNGTTVSGYCSTGPYEISNPPSSLKFVFAHPANAIRFHLSWLTSGDTVGVKINGQPSNVSSINLSPYTACLGANSNFAYNDYIAGTSTSISSNPLVQFDAAGSIDSVEIYMAGWDTSTVSNSAVVFNFSFSFGCLAKYQAQADSPCTGGTLHLSVATDIVDTGVTYNWSGPNSFSATLQNPVITNVQSGAAGMYHVTITDDSCVYYDSVMVTVVPPLIQSAGSNSPLCPGDSLKLNALDTLAGINWQWHGPNSFSDSISDPQIYNIAPADSGNYIVTATLANCSASDTLHVTVKPVPAKPTATSNSPVCETDNLQLNATDSTTGVTYFWTGANSFSAALQNPTRTSVVFSDSGKYMVKATLNGCTSKPDTIDVAVNQLISPFVTITSVPAIIPVGHIDTFTANTTNCSSPAYQWYKNGTPIPGATTNPYADSLAAGEHISVQVHCAPCASPDIVSSNELTTTAVTSPSEKLGEVTVWPNPVTDELYIEAAENCIIHILDVLGRTVYNGMMNNNKEVINMSGLSNGTYILEITNSNGERVMKKIVKE